MAPSLLRDGPVLRRLPVLAFTVLSVALVAPAEASRARGQRSQKAKEHTFGAFIRVHLARLRALDRAAQQRFQHLALVEQARALPVLREAPGSGRTYANARRFASFYSLILQLPESGWVAREPGVDWAERHVQEHILSTMPPLIVQRTEAEIAPAREAAAALEPAAIAMADRRFVRGRQAFLESLQAQSDEILHAQAIRLEASLSRLIGRAGLRKELVEQATYSESVTAHASSSSTARGFGLQVGSSGIGLSTSESHATSSSDYERVVEAKYERFEILPARKYPLRVVTARSMADGQARSGDLSVIQARQIMEVALRLSDTLKALASRPGTMSVTFRDWRAFSQLAIAVPIPGREDVVHTVDLGDVAAGLPSLLETGIVSPTMLHALKSELKRDLPEDLR